ncbi:MAG: hypothetical protein V7724_04360 [Sediminicola sp.]
MKLLIFSLMMLAVCNSTLAQNQWFETYTDSTVLVKDAHAISSLFIADIKKIRPEFRFEGKTMLDTSPALIYYGLDGNIHLPLWEQVLPQLKDFFKEITGSEAEGKRMFGLFFNGFYLPHELGHALQEKTEGTLEPSYDSEYLANTIAVLWLRKHGYQKELEQCYDFAKSMEDTLTDPVPQGVDIEDFFTENYGQATQNPYVYGYMQFKQFVQVYEDSSLPDFDTFIAKYPKR